MALLQNTNYIHNNMFPNPFFDIGNTYIPENIKHAFSWCEYIYLTNGIVRSATDRIIEYFITDISYDSQGGKTDNVKNLFESELDIKTILSDIGKDFLVYGNSIVTIFFPFIRVLKCPKCGLETNSKKIDYKYANKKFTGKCACGKEVNFEVIERKDISANKIKPVRLNPKSIDVKYHPLADRYEYYWNIPNKIGRGIEEGDKFYIDNTPSEVIDAVHEKKLFKLDNNYVFHIKNTSLAGNQIEWGIPLFLNIVKLNYYNAILRRANEAIAQDFIIPFRIISPANTPSFDPIASYKLGDFTSQMSNMIRNHRFDPTTIQISPIPIQYQAFGAEKKALDVTNEIKANIEEMLHSLNYPAELFFNTLRIQTFPPALRLFETTWSKLVFGYNKFLRWFSKHICNFMHWEEVIPSLVKVTIAEDIEKRQVMLQLAGSQQASWIDALKAYGLDFKEQQRKISEQTQIMADIQQELQAEMAAKGQMGEGQQEQTPMNMYEQAQMSAQQLLNMPYEQRVRMMKQMESMNPILYAVTKDMMEKIRSVAKTQQGYQTLAASGMQGHMMPPDQGG